MTVSPESGAGATAGARMSFVSIDDCGATARPNPNDPGPPPAVYECDGANPGLQVNFQDYLDAPVGDFAIHHVASGLSRTQPHTVRIRMWFFEGRNNDVVQVCVDGTTCRHGPQLGGLTTATAATGQPVEHQPGRPPALPPSQPVHRAMPRSPRIRATASSSTT